MGDHQQSSGTSLSISLVNGISAKHETASITFYPLEEAEGLLRPAQGDHD